VINLMALLSGAIKMNASDIHLSEGVLPYLRVRGDLKRVESQLLTEEDMHGIMQMIMPDRLRSQLEEQRGCDFAFAQEGIGRFRVVAYFTDNKLCFALRVIPQQIPTIDELGLPEVLKREALLARGMVLVTGITGSGKSTTLAAMINHLNQTEARRVITIEDPIEFKYSNRKAMISQREVGSDVGSFGTALRQALRADPDVILVGEMRDLETIRIAIKAAEPGHLLFSTLHTTGASHTIERILAHFDVVEHALVREQIALNLRATITQRLAKSAEGKGRVAAMEILLVTDMVKKLILDSRISDVAGIIASREDGMQTMDQALGDLVKAKRVALEEAARHANDYYALRRYAAGVGASGDVGAIVGGH